MARYAPAALQLATELFVRDLPQALAFYTSIGFELVRAETDFALCAWEGNEFMLDRRPDLPPVPSHPPANLRVLVPDVDARWAHARALGVPVVQTIGDRYYGLRDFTIVDPDGYGLRFASYLDPKDLPSGE